MTSGIARTFERSGIEVFGQGTFGISKRSRKERNSRAKMRLKVGFSFPPVILAYALQCKRLSGLPNLQATAHAKDSWENRSSRQPKRNTADTIVC